MMPRIALRRRSGGTSVLALSAPFFSAQRSRLIRLSIISVVAGFAEAGVLVLIARIAFALTSDKQQVSISLGPLGTESFDIEFLLALAIALVVVRILLQAASVVLGTRATAAVGEITRRNLLTAYLATSWPLQAAQRDGRLQELLTTYVSAVSNSFGAVSQGIINGFNLTALLVTALWVSPLASLGAALAALAIGLLLRPLRAAVRRRSSRAASAGLDLATGVTELSANLQEVRIFGVKQAVGERLDVLNRNSARQTLLTGYIASSVGVIYQGLALLLIVGALGISYAVGLTGLASLGTIVLIALRSLSYAQAVQGSIQVLYQSAPYVEALEQEEAAYLGAAVQHGGRTLERIGSLAFDRVDFEYELGHPVLRDMSFAAHPGEIIGIVGPSGSGKSTLVQLLLRLREPSAGKFLVEGVDAREFALDDWYRNVSFVPQEPRLFAGTIAENIRFFRDGIDAAAVERAARLANLHDDIVSQPQGYDTPVGERGGQLSGGQRQRLCIARALVGEPSLIVLDEPTSSLDVRSEALIRETVGNLGGKTTVFIVAHRLSTLAVCDRIMAVLDGVLEGFDDPATLEATNPFYRETLKLSGLR